MEHSKKLELLPCPFCGGEATTYIERGDDHSRYGKVSCRDCGGSTSSEPLHWMDNTDAELKAQFDAEIRWNRRA